MPRDDFDSSFALYKYKVFSKIGFGETLSYIGISKLFCSAYQLIGLYISYRGLSKTFDYVTVFFVLSS